MANRVLINIPTTDKIEASDIYEELDQINYKAEETELVKGLRGKNQELESKIIVITKENEDLKHKYKCLQERMSSLMLTARAELARNKSTITALREELDNMKFRRGSYRKTNTAENYDEKKSQGSNDNDNKEESQLKQSKLDRSKSPVARNNSNSLNTRPKSKDRLRDRRSSRERGARRSRDRSRDKRRSKEQSQIIVERLRNNRRSGVQSKDIRRSIDRSRNIRRSRNRSRDIRRSRDQSKDNQRSRDRSRRRLRSADRTRDTRKSRERSGERQSSREKTSNREKPSENDAKNRSKSREENKDEDKQEDENVKVCQNGDSYKSGEDDTDRNTESQIRLEESIQDAKIDDLPDDNDFCMLVDTMDMSEFVTLDEDDDAQDNVDTKKNLQNYDDPVHDINKVPYKIGNRPLERRLKSRYNPTYKLKPKEIKGDSKLEKKYSPPEKPLRVSTSQELLGNEFKDLKDILFMAQNYGDRRRDNEIDRSSKITNNVLTYEDICNLNSDQYLERGMSSSQGTMPNTFDIKNPDLQVNELEVVHPVHTSHLSLTFNNEFHHSNDQEPVNSNHPPRTLYTMRRIKEVALRNAEVKAKSIIPTQENETSLKIDIRKPESMFLKTTSINKKKKNFTLDNLSRSKSVYNSSDLDVDASIDDNGCNKDMRLKSSQKEVTSVAVEAKQGPEFKAINEERSIKTSLLDPRHIHNITNKQRDPRTKARRDYDLKDICEIPAENTNDIIKELKSPNQKSIDELLIMQEMLEKDISLLDEENNQNTKKRKHSDDSVPRKTSEHIKYIKSKSRRKVKTLFGGALPLSRSKKIESISVPPSDSNVKNERLTIVKLHQEKKLINSDSTNDEQTTTEEKKVACEYPKRDNHTDETLKQNNSHQSSADATLREKNTSQNSTNEKLECITHSQGDVDKPSDDKIPTQIGIEEKLKRKTQNSMDKSLGDEILFQRNKNETLGCEIPPQESMGETSGHIPTLDSIRDTFDMLEYKICPQEIQPETSRHNILTHSSIDRTFMTTNSMPKVKNINKNENIGKNTEKRMRKKYTATNNALENIHSTENESVDNSNLMVPTLPLHSNIVQDLTFTAKNCSDQNYYNKVNTDENLVKNIPERNKTNSSNSRVNEEIKSCNPLKTLIEDFYCSSDEEKAGWQTINETVSTDDSRSDSSQPSDEIDKKSVPDSSSKTEMHNTAVTTENDTNFIAEDSAPDSSSINKTLVLEDTNDHGEQPPILSKAVLTAIEAADQKSKADMDESTEYANKWRRSCYNHSVNTKPETTKNATSRTLSQELINCESINREENIKNVKETSTEQENSASELPDLYSNIDEASRLQFSPQNNINESLILTNSLVTGRNTIEKNLKSTNKRKRNEDSVTRKASENINLTKKKSKGNNTKVIQNQPSNQIIQCTTINVPSNSNDCNNTELITKMDERKRIETEGVSQAACSSSPKRASKRSSSKHVSGSKRKRKHETIMQPVRLSNENEKSCSPSRVENCEKKEKKSSRSNGGKRSSRSKRRNHTDERNQKNMSKSQKDIDVAKEHGINPLITTATEIPNIAVTIPCTNGIDAPVSTQSDQIKANDIVEEGTACQKNDDSSKTDLIVAPIEEKQKSLSPTSATPPTFVIKRRRNIIIKK